MHNETLTDEELDLQVAAEVAMEESRRREEVEALHEISAAIDRLTIALLWSAQMVCEHNFSWEGGLQGAFLHVARVAKQAPNKAEA